MKTIGLTGSIGMGKTETAKLFAEQGIPVFDSDAAVHDLLGSGGAAVEKVEKIFPSVKKADYIDRKKLGAKVFGNSVALEKLENLLHPMVTSKRNEFLKNISSDLVIFDIPLLFEKGYEKDFDFIIVVSAASDIQKKRVLERAGMTEQRYADILSKQMPDAEKTTRADFIIQTDRGLNYAKNQVIDIIKKIRE